MNKLKIWFLKMCLKDCVESEDNFCFRYFRFKLFLARKINKKETPCKPDHNGECLICDCWLENCAFKRWKNKDYKYETEEELNKMFDGS
jgi:hypothetical protein